MMLKYARYISQSELHKDMLGLRLQYIPSSQMHDMHKEATMCSEKVQKCQELRHAPSKLESSVGVAEASASTSVVSGRASEAPSIWLDPCHPECSDVARIPVTMVQRIWDLDFIRKQWKTRCHKIHIPGSQWMARAAPDVFNGSCTWRYSSNSRSAPTWSKCIL
jgi:hypothetical protein